MKKILIIAILMIFGTNVHSTTFYSEDFEGSAPNYSGGANWLGNVFTYALSTTNAKSGQKSMLFSYAPGWNISVEERFELTVPSRDIYISFWWRVPDNFFHYVRPEGSNTPCNSKLLSVWMDGYSYQGMGPTMVWVFWCSETLLNGSDLSMHYNPGAMPGQPSNTSVTSGQIANAPFIRVPEDRGRWMHLVFHGKAATSRGSNDGVMETFRKWEGEVVHTRIQRIEDADIPAPANGPNGWKNGYLMGWSNPGYDTKTDFYIDDFIIGDTFPNAPVVPNPPGSFRVH